MLAQRAEPVGGIATGRAMPLLGLLSTTDNRPIVINGVGAPTGMTVTSGALLQTPAGVRATVLLSNLGWIDIEPDSRLTLNFAAGKIEVELKKGCVLLTAEAGVAGELKTPQGAAGRIDSWQPDSLDACADQSAATAAVPDGAVAAVPAAPGREPARRAVGGVFSPLWYAIGASPSLAAGIRTLDRDGRPAPVSRSIP
ncbi:MAG: hypothetical protein ACRD9R_16125, partial [Pyrinomonadaceae bacterium]